MLLLVKHGLVSTPLPMLLTLQGTKEAAANFGGYQDFVLDNVSIELVEETVNKDMLVDLIEEAKANYNQSDYQPEDWASLSRH